MGGLRAHLRGAGTFVALASLVISLAAPALADDLQNKQNQRDQLNAQIAETQRRIKAVLAQEADAEAKLAALTPLIRAAETQLAQENARLDELTGQVDKVQRDLEQKRAEEREKKALLAQRTRVLYKAGGNLSIIDTLFSSTNFSEMLDRFLVMRDVTHADQVLVQQIEQDKVAIAAMVIDLSSKRADQAATVRVVQDQTNELQSEYAAEAALRAQLQRLKGSLQAQQAAAQASLNQVNNEIAALQAARHRAHSSGIFAWPGVQGPITQPFGCTDFAGEPPPPQGYSCPRSEPYFHTGIDIAGPNGSEIDAADGGIAYTYPGSSGYGNHVIIVHANGYVTLYGHMSTFAISDGAPVAKGQRIGYEGSTGFSSGPHLHFEIRLNNSPRDPCQYVGC